eukprot:PhF_6_TR16932/c0_g1_i1/m.25475/K10396/KIF5; kinesin family member 5
MSKTIQVMVRIRPPNNRELQEGTPCNVLTIDGSKKVIQVEGINETFTFHRVFDTNSTQDEVFDVYAKQSVEMALEGFHGILFAYGQTGSGKTYTLSGHGSEVGVLQKCLNYIWDRRQQDTEHMYAMQVSYIELYNELFTDLLCDDGEDSGLTMHQADDVALTRANGEEIGRDVHTVQDAFRFFEIGYARKATAETNMNDRSSRSHTIFTVYISKQPKAGGECVNGRLILCDLAGSERQSKTKATGQRIEEAKSINKSLMQLGLVVKQMAERSSAPSFRNSKLTMLLRYSLCGRGCTTIMVNVSPASSNKSESLGSMRFGQCAITIKQEPEKHVDLDYKSLCSKLKKQIEDLEARLQSRDQEAIKILEEEYERRLRDLRSDIDAGRDYSQVIMIAEQSTSAAPSADAPDTVRYLHAIKRLKIMMEEKEKELRISQQKLIEVTHSRDTEREKAISLACVLRNKEREFARKECLLLERIDSLRVLTEKGQMDLTSTEVTQDDDKVADAMAAVFTELNEGDGEGGDVGGAVTRMGDELQRAQRCIAILRDQRVALRQQLSMAKNAIRLLHEQKLNLEARMNGS